ncbi:MAG TPA: hypothetical protein VLC49_10050 [Solirubrobacteraceae bacterium]|nr:hypothetical protein [Solirubrobacteraceae bacterium]
MLAGDRFGDRPVSVCPVIGAILRAYNDNVDDRRRQDLYRFAADAVGTRRDYRVQRVRADAAIDWALARYRERGGTLLAPPDPEGLRDEIGYYVVGALHGRGRWSDDEHASMIALLENLIEIDREPALIAEPLVPLVADLLEEVAQPLEHAGGYHEFVLAEGLQCSAEAGLEASPAVLDETASVLGERGEHDAPVTVGALAPDQAGSSESFEHFGHARRTQVRSLRELANRHLTLVAKAEEQTVLRVGELARSVGLAPAQPPHRGHRTLERPGHVLGGVALVALAYTVAKRR